MVPDQIDFSDFYASEDDTPFLASPDRTWDGVRTTPLRDNLIEPTLLGLERGSSDEELLSRHSFREITGPVAARFVAQVLDIEPSVPMIRIAEAHGKDLMGVEPYMRLRELALEYPKEYAVYSCACEKVFGLKLPHISAFEAGYGMAA